MKRLRLLILMLLLLPVAGFSQGFINKNRSAVKKKLHHHIARHDSLKMLLTESDSTLVLSIRDTKIQPADFTYHFDRAGQCNSEMVTASCDSCFQKLLQGVLSRKKYGWKKINANQYISNYSARMLLEIPPENTNHSFRIIRTNWTRKLYRISMEGY